METYPIMLDGVLAGKLKVEEKGARTVFDAECKMRPELVRISVYGGGREGYLGVLAPEGEALILHRALSREQMRAFPAEIESVERAGRSAAAAAEPEAPSEPKAPAAPETPADAGRAPAPVEEEKEAVPADTGTLDWYASPDGALVCFDGEHSLIALPLGDARIPEGVAGQRRAIEGGDYLVYPTKDGKIVR